MLLVLLLLSDRYNLGNQTAGGHCFTPTKCAICAAATEQIQITKAANAGPPGRNTLPMQNTSTAMPRQTQSTLHH
jgi:hypothetical protein